MASARVLHTLFEQQRHQTPDAIALRSDTETLTYRQLDQRANAMANDLLLRGVKPKDVVGVYLNKSPNLIVSLLGVLKTGACYLPLDPYYPHERLDYMVNHANARLVITDDEHALKLAPGHREIVDINQVDLTYQTTPTLPTVSEEDLCYVMYTSGSTGTPKGVMVSHRTVVNYLAWMQSAFVLHDEDVVLNQSTFSFDVSVWEIFWPLIAGASCAVITEDAKYDPLLLAEFMCRHQVTVSQFVPTALRVIVDAEVLPRCTSLCHIFSGGEALDQTLVNDLSLQYTGKIHNLYGPTEATIFACHWHCQPGAKEKIAPIGKPIPHAAAYVLDEAQQPVDVGESGELYLAGDILAKGYLNAEKLTQERFVDDPFSHQVGQKMYKTGDWVKQRANGVLEFIGRIDSQVKLRGHRIELAEIETHLQALPQINHAAVILEKRPESAAPSLSAFYVLRHQKHIDIQEIKAHLAKTLPFFMVPSHFIALEKMPTHPNGKIDKSKLSSRVNN
ncbi:amino acid adenylation domain-containing protein [Pectobacterium versatile]|uniref:amino acid adenylation domain-containing protein n=1 Tax=Pectobacterium versatile TaxID=2488639 RepID=UPI0020C1524F|nr:amino acid adenylation domain-containing protein [Pectobacterium versatile]MCO4313107.1 amino acid adenylation domain-containing protein [Pectobacterium versatile]